MNDTYFAPFNPKLDLMLERTIDAPPELVWQAWTEPKHLKVWYTPLPWLTDDCEVDLRPGGLFRVVMRLPDGGNNVVTASYLEVVPNKRLVWTDALLPGYRPAEKPTIADVSFLTVMIEMEAAGKGTHYRATCLHRHEAGRNKHAEMGFYEGWGTAVDQLVEHLKTMK